MPAFLGGIAATQDMLYSLVLPPFLEMPAFLGGIAAGKFAAISGKLNHT